MSDDWFPSHTVWTGSRFSQSKMIITQESSAVKVSFQTFNLSYVNYLEGTRLRILKKRVQCTDAQQAVPHFGVEQRLPFQPRSQA
jgi:hypothetical protein